MGEGAGAGAATGGRAPVHRARRRDCLSGRPTSRPPGLDTQATPAPPRQTSDGGPAPRRSAAMRGVEQALPDGWIPRARVASTRANATSESPPRISVRARERVTIEPFARRCVGGRRARRGEASARRVHHQRLAEARLAFLCCGVNQRASICIKRMGDQSLKNARGGFLRSDSHTRQLYLRQTNRSVAGKVETTVGCVLARTPGAEKEGPGDHLRATMPIPPINSLVKYDHPVQVRRPPARASRVPPPASFETRPGVAETSIRADGDPACRLSRATRPRADASLVSSRRRSPPRRISGSPEGPRYASAPPSLARTRPTTRPAKRLSRGRPRLNLESNPLAPPPARGRPRPRAALLPHHPSLNVTSATRAPTPRSRLPAHVSSPLPPPRPVLLLRRRARCPPFPTGSPAPRRRRTS